MRDLVFISYSHDDRGYLDEFVKNLGPLASSGLMKVWSDREIQPGTRWAAQIGEALSKARVGLLLVSANFINSEFIRNEELRLMLAAAEEGELALFWVPIGASTFETVGLGQWQAAPGCDPEHPLDGMRKPQREQAIVRVCRGILDLMGRLPVMTRGDRGDLQKRVADTVGEKYELLEEIGTGSSSIVYKARAKVLDRTVVVKTLVAAGVEQQTDDGFRARADIAKKLVHPAYITLYDEFIDHPPYCVVTEYVDGTCLDRVELGALTPRRVRLILLDLARALAEAHAKDYLHEGLMPSNVHLERASHRPRISAFRFLNIGPSTGMWGTFLVNHESCTYLSPEQFDGRPRSTLTDQYALGLLGYELLGGRRIERVTRPADFVHRPEFFRRLERSGDWTTRAPALAGIIARLLRVDAKQRWRSMDEVADMLEAVVVEDSADAAARRQVLASYSSFQTSDGAQELCRSFYQHLFAALPEVQPLFAHTDMPRQHEALNQAIKLLLDYSADPVSGAAAVKAVGVRHQRFGLGSRHLDAFQTALLAALTDAGVPADIVAAWRNVLAPGLTHMRGVLQGRTTREGQAFRATPGGPP